MTRKTDTNQSPGASILTELADKIWSFKTVVEIQTLVDKYSLAFGEIGQIKGV